MSENSQQSTTNFSDILGNLNRQGMSTEQDIAQSLRILTGLMQKNPEAFGLGKRAPTESQSNYSESKWKLGEGKHSVPKYKSTGNPLKDFENGIKKELLDSLAGGNFKKGMQGALDTFAKEFGMDIRDLPAEAGKAVTQKALKAFSNSETGKKLKAEAAKSGERLLNNLFGGDEKGQAIKGGIKNVVNSFLSGGQDIEGLDAVANLAQGAGEVSEVASSVGAASEGMAGLATVTPELSGALIEATMASGGLAAVLVAAAAVWLEIYGPALEGFFELVKSVGKSFNKSEEVRKKRAENAQKRLEADTEYMVKRPFEILEKAAEAWYNAWDNNINKIGQTQGYNKESLYALYESYADRLAEDNLAASVDVTEVINNLSSVLASGLSGEIAEEFAYIATKLNNAIPTQDFFSYVNDYTAVASNAVAQGKSQQEAIELANSQLYAFADTLTTASRELAGGFTVGLKDGSQLFSDAVKIAQSAKSENISGISGTLASVSAIIGSVAPDLASSLVDNIVQAAIGGNDSTIVALRSLAGIDASNTQFLQKMAQDPQAIFSDLFNNLAAKQTMSPDNYMEVAEGLASIFGIDKAAFARIDFSYLAQKIDELNANGSALKANLELLASGETTPSAAQLKNLEMQRIIQEEGLAYVIDSEEGRMIQQHMWDEQRDNALMENTFAVDIQGSALKFLEGIRETITNLLNFFNPIGFIANGVGNLVESVTEAIGNEQDIAEILQLGAVGSNTQAFNNLTTRGKDLALTTSLVEMMGGNKGITALNWLSDAAQINAYVRGGLISSKLFNTVNDATSVRGLLQSAFMKDTSVSKSSRYSWNSVGKSIALGIQSHSMNTNVISSAASLAAEAASNAAERAQEISNKRFEEFLATAKDAVAGDNPLSYDEWVATAKTMGISDFDAALDAFGRTEDELKAYFTSNATAAGAEIENQRKEDEVKFRQETRDFWDYANGSSGVFQTAVWLPFFGDGQKYDTRMDYIDSALTDIQVRVGSPQKHTVISGIEELSDKLGDVTTYTVISILTQIHDDISSTFISTSSAFQRCLASWTRYIASSEQYTATVNKSAEWNSLKNAERDEQVEATLALANALGVFSAEELKKLDPQLQTNVLLGQIVTILQTIMQQNNTQGGSLSLLDTMSALGMGMTFKST